MFDYIIGICCIFVSNKRNYLDTSQNISDTIMRRLWKRFNISSYQPDFAKWLIELSISEDNQQYKVSAGKGGHQLDDITGMSTTARDNLSSGIQGPFDVDANDTGGNISSVFKISSSDLNITESSLDYSESALIVQDYVLIVLYSVTTLLAILGNSTAIVIFTKGKRSKTDLRPFLINLAVADLIMAIFCIPFTFTYSLLGDWVFSDPMCPIVMFLQTASVTGSVSTNMAIGIDRFCAITFPLNSTRTATNRYRLTILTIWLIAIALSAVILFVGRTQDNPITNSKECKEMWPNNDLAFFYTILILILTYVIPLIILTITYSIVGCVLWKRNLPGNADAQRDASQLKAKSKVCKVKPVLIDHIKQNIFLLFRQVVAYCCIKVVQNAGAFCATSIQQLAAICL